MADPGVAFGILTQWLFQMREMTISLSNNMDFHELKNKELLEIIKNLHTDHIQKILEDSNVKNPENHLKKLLLSVMILIDLEPDWDGILAELENPT